MKYVAIRRGIGLVSLLLLPITQFYFSPYLSMNGAWEGIINASLLVFGGLFCLGLVVGRAPCGWFMPCGGLQEACFRVQPKSIPAGRRDRIKLVLWALWLAALVMGLVLAALRGPVTVDPSYHLEGGISISEPWLYFIYYGVVFLIVGLSLIVGKRATCHYLCWMAPFMMAGRAVSNRLKLPGLRLVRQAGDCSRCQHCTKACPMGIDTGRAANELSPGTTLASQECLLCAECQTACPQRIWKIRLSPPRTVGK